MPKVNRIRELPHDDNLILTGSADHSVPMFDRRNLTSGGVGAPIYKFVGHTAAVLCVQWSPDKSSVFGSSAEDGLLNIWDYEKVSKKERTSKNSTSPPGLFFQHAGHRDKVVDFHWNASDPWTVVSVSDDCDTTGGGGTLQVLLGFSWEAAMSVHNNPRAEKLRVPKERRAKELPS
ncbi:hypothetical protein ACLB2K_022713 [Fragaria x ananassa]